MWFLLVAALLAPSGQAPAAQLIPGSVRDATGLPLPIFSVVWIKAEGDYARIHASGESYLVYRTLNELEGRLAPADFLRVHRSAIVRLDQIAEVMPADSGRYHLTLSNGTRLIVSRSRGTALKKLML